VGRKANAKAEIGGRDITVHHFFVLPPLSKKRRTKSARLQEKRQENLGVSFMKTGGCPSGMPYEREALREEVQKGRRPQE